ncbi:MAG: hypothetical protein A3C88_00050 [Candidatus Yanofskybacteria bacterium RIFCSPHIGHO2_02_FULL_50_12]|uniref:Uncharacterized protein n=1 Tax=Candidatus Yanofskybacteria bacterium RIFCSPHIGHO2_02_FULL_50_12 TaxID=1802685 RepID=A0A1F8FUP4_9BACT|nr:MAG: hypothetical protein A3C88_00050 [Candidatus Yanofskybacteria bacterium RIFCSPHIGHO2_02_FULL_50_12]
MVEYLIEMRHGPAMRVECPTVLGLAPQDSDPIALEQARKRLAIHKGKFTPERFRARGGVRIVRNLLPGSRYPKYRVVVFPPLDLRTASQNDILHLAERVPYAWLDPAVGRPWPAAKLTNGCYLVTRDGQHVLLSQGDYIVRAKDKPPTYGYVRYLVHETQSLLLVPNGPPF